MMIRMLSKLKLLCSGEKSDNKINTILQGLEITIFIYSELPKLSKILQRHFETACCTREQKHFLYFSVENEHN